MEFDCQGRLASMMDTAGKIVIPIDTHALTQPFLLFLRNQQNNKTVPLVPAENPRINQPESNMIEFIWSLKPDEGEIMFKASVCLPEGAESGQWRCEIKNHTSSAIWEIDYPRISGLASFAKTTPDWLAGCKGMGQKNPDPVKFINSKYGEVSEESRREYNAFDTENGIAFSYPGMWTMQFVAYGHPECGGIYFAAHDSDALFKKFGLYVDGSDGQHAALIMKQYPRDRTLAGGDFKSFYPVVTDIYKGDWWGASAIYKQWAIKQKWCAKGPARKRDDIPEWLKKTDLWYWNARQYLSISHADQLDKAFTELINRFGLSVLPFHWYGYTGEFGPLWYWHGPEVYPHDPDIRDELQRCVERFHALNARLVPYVCSRLWHKRSRSFRAAEGEKWMAIDENGKSADEWSNLFHTMCPTAPAFHDLNCGIINQLIEELRMDGVYMDQVTSCYAVPCFNPAHDHPPGGHDHWCRGYRALAERVRNEMRERKADAIMTSESVIECFLDYFDADLAREISNLKGFCDAPGSLPIPLFHSVYHEYHMTYGSVMSVAEPDMDHFRFAEALCLVGGSQLSITGYANAEVEKAKPRIRAEPYLKYYDKLIGAHKAGREWLNGGAWKPPLDISCDRKDIIFDAKQAAKKNIPVIISGCFELNGELCAVLINHTDKAQKYNFELGGNEYGFFGRFKVEQIYPERKYIGEFTDYYHHEETFAAESAMVLRILKPRG